MSKFQFIPPSAPTPEKFRLALPPDVVSWIESEATQAGCTREAVLEQAVKFAFDSLRSEVEVQPKRSRKPAVSV